MLISAVAFSASCIEFPKHEEQIVYAAKSADQLKKEIEDAQKAREDINKQIKQKENEKQQSMDLKKQIDKELNDINEDIDAINDVIDEKESLIKQKEKEIDEVNEKIDAKKDLLKQRLRIMYEQGSASYLDILMSSKGFGDLLTRIAVTQDIVRYDNNMIDELVENIQKITEAKQVIEEEQKEQEEVRDMLKTTQRKAEQKQAEQKSIMDKLQGDIKELEKSYDEALKKMNDAQAELNAALKAAPNVNTKYTGGTFLWPSQASTRITSPYGNRVHPIFKTVKYHSGIDIGAASGTNILAAADGVVITATYSSSYGNYVVISHGSGITTLYAHSSKLLVKKGDTVKRGQTIALVGSTGYATGPHLHFEVSVNGSRVNPMNYFK